MNTIDIIKKYTAGESTLEDTNKALKDAGAAFHLEPGKNEIKPGEETTYGLLDSGTGTMDKVEVKDGKLVHGMGDAFALLFFNGKKYEVKDTELIEI